jgi:hypothetical protein
MSRMYTLSIMASDVPVCWATVGGSTPCTWSSALCKACRKELYALAQMESDHCVALARSSWLLRPGSPDTIHVPPPESLARLRSADQLGGNRSRRARSAGDCDQSSLTRSSRSRAFAHYHVAVMPFDHCQGGSGYARDVERRHSVHQGLGDEGGEPGSIYDPDSNAIYSATTGLPTWTGSKVDGIGAVAGSYVVAVYGSQAIAVLY